MFEWTWKKDIHEMALKNIKRVVKEKGCLTVEKNHQVKTVHLQFEMRASANTSARLP